MWSNVTPRQNAYGVKEFICDTEDDVKDVPLATTLPGSKVYVVESNKTYILNHTLNWEMKSGAYDQVILDGGEP